LDFVRGFALFGILVVNIGFFSMPSFQALHPPIGGGRSETLSWGIVRALFELKFMALFSMLFGMGFTLQSARLMGQGGRIGMVFLRRLGILAVLGLIHAVLIWNGDILFVYAAAGAILYWTRKWPWKRHLTVGVTGLLLATGIHVAVEAMERREPIQPSASRIRQAPDDRDPRWLWALKNSHRDPSLFSEAESIAYKQGPMKATIVVRTVAWLGMLIVMYGLAGYFLRVVALFFLGVALMKAGLFESEHEQWPGRLCRCGIAIGFPLEVGAAIVMHFTGYPSASFLGVVLAGIHDLASVVMAVGILGGATLIARSGALPWIRSLLERVGRMALTNYLGQSVMTTGVMYWWGLGLFGEISRPRQLSLVAALFLVQVALSTLWLRVFRLGPLEWGWRSLTYLRWQALRR